MSAFQKAEALATQRYDRDKLLALVDEVTTHFRMPNSFERSKMRAVCRHLADALDRCNGSTLQQRWNDFEKKCWPKWKDGINRPGGTYWTWGARVLISARMVVPSLDMLANIRVNQWVAHLPDDLERVATWVGVLTGLSLDATQGSITPLNNAAWSQKCDRLKRSGGSPGM